MRNANVLYPHFQFIQKVQMYLKSHGFPGSLGTINKGRQLHGHESWPTQHIWHPDHNNPVEVQKSSKLIEDPVMASN